MNFNKECGSIESLDLHEPDESTSCNGAPSAIYYFFNNDLLGNFYFPFSDHLGLFGQLPIRVHDHFPFASFDIKGKQRAWTKTASDVVAFHSLPASVQTGKTRLPPVTINTTTVINDSRSVLPLIERLKDEDATVRKNVASALLRIRDPRAVDPLLSAWNDENSDVRTRSAEALVEIGNPAIKSLLAALNSKNSYVRWRATWCLGRIRDSIAVESLILRLNDEATEVKWTAVGALGEIGDKRASEPLFTLCSDKDPGIREKAGLTLRRIKGEEIMPGVSE